LTDLILPTNTYKPDIDNLFTVKHEQEITDDLLATNKELRDASSAPAGDYHKIASIPTVVVEQWMREGFNIYDENVTAADIVLRLQREDLGAFLTTNKRV
jgi:hypothetical protein